MHFLLAQLVDSKALLTVVDVEEQLELLIANAMQYNEDGSFEQQQAKKLTTLIKKEIPRAMAAETRIIRQQEEREEAERQAALAALARRNAALSLAHR